MGVNDLRQLLASKSRKVKLCEILSDKDVGVDASVWLHMYVSVMHEDITKKNFTRTVESFVNRLKDLKRMGARPIVVFDGAPTPMKSRTNSARNNKRKEKADALASQLEEHAAKGEEPPPDLLEQLSKVNAGVSRELVYAVIRRLREDGFAYVVAPYEADHTLVAMLREQTIQYIISVDSDMLVHEGGNLVVSSADLHGGMGTLFEPAGPTAPLDADKESMEECQRDLGHIIDDLAEEKDCEPQVAAAAVCLAYALLVKTDYHDIRGVGPSTALAILDKLLDKQVDVGEWLKPETLACMLSEHKVWSREQEKEVCLLMKTAKGGLLAGVGLFLASGKVDTLDQNVLAETDVSALVGKMGLDKDHVDLIALGLLCLREMCECNGLRETFDCECNGLRGMCECDGRASKQHDVGDGVTQVQPQDDLKPVALTEDMIIGAKMSESEVDTAKQARLARWLRTRGQFPGNRKVAELRADVRTQLRVEEEARKENRALTNLRCPEGLSALQILRNNRRRTRELPIIDNAEVSTMLKGIQEEDWISSIGKMQERAPVLSETVLQAHFKDVCTKDGVLEKGYKRIYFRTHLRGFGAYYPPRNGDLFPNTCWLRFLCPRSMVNGVYQVYAKCEVEWRPNNRPPVITTIKDQMCECPAARADSGCVHVSALLNAVLNLSRDHHEDGPATNRRCEWNRPRQVADEELVNDPLAYLIFERAQRTPREKKRRYGEPVCRQNTLGRLEYNPFPPDVHAATLRNIAERGRNSNFVKALATCIVEGAATCPGDESAASQMFEPVLTGLLSKRFWNDHALAELRRTGLDELPIDESTEWALDSIFDEDSENKPDMW